MTKFVGNSLSQKRKPKRKKMCYSKCSVPPGNISSIFLREGPILAVLLSIYMANALSISSCRSCSLLSFLWEPKIFVKTEEEEKKSPKEGNSMGRRGIFQICVM